MFGGSVNGGQVLGKYPDNFSEGDPAGLALSRGRMLPTYPWGECTLSNKQLSSHYGSLTLCLTFSPLDSMWKGVAEWFGITPAGMDKVLPMHRNFPPDKIYNASDLFV